MKTPLVLWWIGDGKPGHENQSLGLAEAMQRHRPCAIHRISIAGKRSLLARLRRSLAASAGFPKPDFIIAAGHATHLPLLWLARKHRARSIVLMRPSMPLAWFDHCIAPSHDFPDGCGAPNVILTRGAINRVTCGEGEKSGKLILIGGPSKKHGWDGAELIRMLARTTDRGGWELTDSRRTPEGFLDQVRGGLPGVTAFSHRETPPTWVPEKLQQAKEVWVTEDSVSMIYEALSSGARVGLLPTPRVTGFSRVLSGIDGLVEDGYLTTFADWLHTERLNAPPQALQEADRCAEITLQIAFREGNLKA